MRYISMISIKFKLSDHAIKSHGRPFKGSTTPMVEFYTHEFKI